MARLIGIIALALLPGCSFPLDNPADPWRCPGPCADGLVCHNGRCGYADLGVSDIGLQDGGDEPDRGGDGIAADWTWEAPAPDLGPQDMSDDQPYSATFPARGGHHEEGWRLRPGITP